MPWRVSTILGGMLAAMLYNLSEDDVCALLRMRHQTSAKVRDEMRGN